MTEVEKRIISEILALPFETKAQLVEILTQSMDETCSEDFTAVLREIEGKDKVENLNQEGRENIE
jgi:hypothetical protein